MRAEYRVLGPLEVLLDGEPVAVPAGRCHVLLAVLLLRANQFLSVDELIDRVWDGEPPTADRAHKTLQMVVRRLRVALGDADCVRTRPGGYQAAVDPDQLDLLRFRALVGSGDFGAASALWRGSVLANVPSERLHRENVPHLVTEWLTVLERRIDADLDRGLAGELVAELRSLCAEHPLREPFWRHLMLALYLSGQQAEALAAYQDVREKLVDELGIDPGPALQDLHQQILRAEVSPGRRQVPRQLPAGVRNFVGRDPELALLAKTAGVTVVHGVGGVGKTALVLRWAREVREGFPDGDLYVNLRGFDPEAQPIDPSAAAEMLLIGLGADAIPTDADARFALLRTTLVDRRLLLVLDNAASARQVLPLLPGAACVRVVITSRNQLRALVSQHDATAIELRQLDFEAARSLLAAVLGSDRVDAEPEPAREIVERCAGLPLGLRVFAERVSRFPGTSLREFVDELAAARLDALTDFEDVDVRTVFSWSYRALDDESARMFRLLSGHPGPDFDVSAAAALAGVSVAQSRRLLERLVADHLVQSRSPGRYDLHDLLRVYSAELCGDDEAAVLRVIEWYVHTLENATARDDGKTRVWTGPVESGVEPQQFSSWTEALTWRRQEWENLKAVLHAAIARGWGHLAVPIPLYLGGYIAIQSSHWHDGVEMFEAVQGLGTSRQEAFLMLRMASLYGDSDRLEDSERCFEAVGPLMRAEGDRYGEAVALMNRTGIYRRLGRVEEELGFVRAALAIAVELGDHYLLAAGHINAAEALHAIGRSAEALPHAELAVEAATGLSDEYLKTRVRGMLAATLARVGRYAEAVPGLQMTVEAVRKIGDRYNEAELLEDLGVAFAGLDQREEAAAAWQRAIDIWLDVRDVRAKALAARLAELDGPVKGP
ncbi:BTAD domain-containing putative transcriptional regulator [Lentzea sp. BCCO 10_0856]|uniref:BTAD domain-containing putative transcriptional regulator n=1 Tax=Lentzea miocenica TaxID=3095431 RepID=A0ABU4T2G5_9PSEU|nr:BTAD domain-containing putative transcriptional regulator [Lentzea sp. BCCO 10_0856]MDX8032342.1 BTAD domain-containing putative transcriptional regulator [Lentzea sp. BCCO 10_0856]